MSKLSLDKTKSIYLFTLFFSVFTINNAAAQKTQRQYEDSIINRYADRSAKGFNKAMPYYIIVGKDALPSSTHIIRQLDENSAIIAINTPAAFDSIKTQLRIAPASNKWKLSPALEKGLGKKTAQQKFIITGTTIDALLPFLQKGQKELTILSTNKPSHSVIIRTSAAYIAETLINLNEV